MLTRAFLKRHLPSPARAAANKLRAALSRSPVDELALANYGVERDDSEKPRLTFVIQYLSKGADFGGAATALDLFSRLALAVRSLGAADFRVLITHANSQTDPTIAVKWAARAGLAITTDQIELLSDYTDTISVRANEVFFVIAWFNVANFSKVRARQAEIFKRPQQPLLWLVQDYEPGFLGFSTAHMLARAAYNTSYPLWGIINSGSLADFIEFMGHRFDSRYVFEPVVVEALRPYLERVEQSRREKRLLVYGRPTVERNCFSAITRGLRRWVKDYPEFADWEVVSAGWAHDPIALGDGRKLVSAGKLSLEDYAEMLLSSSVGVSLMASPHPSYPPLEMAHFGLRTVTNTYPCKDLATYHPNIVSVSSIDEEELARAIARACELAVEPVRFEANPDYVRSDIYPFVGELASGLHRALTGAQVHAEDRDGLG